MTQQRQKLFSMAAIVVAAVLFGMVLAGGLDVTQRADAERSTEVEPIPAAPATVSGGGPDFAELADRVMPSVVSVFATDKVTAEEMRQRGMGDPLHRFFGPFFRQEPPEEPQLRRSEGSGFFISSDGEILTNNHVVEEADRLEIELYDGARYEVEVVGTDPATDLALLQVEDPDREFAPLRLGRSEALRVGEWVMAVGNPLRLDHTVTVGVVSAKGRALGIADTSFESYIQTDAAINFGNSGGPLVNLRGEVVGINTAINARGQNLGFAVPVRIAKRILDQLREHGKVVRGYLGVTISEVTPEKQEAFGLEDRKGAFVEEVSGGHAADEAGVEPGDVIVAVDDRPVETTRELIDTVSARAPGTEVELTVIRDGAKRKIGVTLEERPGEDELVPSRDDGDEESSVMDRVGLTVTELTPRLRRMLQLDADLDGVVVTEVELLSPAGEKGLSRGDVITDVNGRRVESVDDLVEAIDAVEPGGYVRLYVHRPQAGRSFFAILELPE